MDIKKIISEMTLEEKASLLSGLDFWHTKPIERLGIPSVMVSDGPHGLRKQDEQADHLGINQSIPAVCFPTACATAASFDREALFKIGEGVGVACQHEKVAVNLGPAVNIKRSPLCGRNFEYFSEDPFLAAELSTALIKGVQSKNVGVSVKHFAANSQEHRRMSSDSVVDERTLREIYYPAFESAVKEGKAWTVMCSYNKVNGTYASENRRLLTDVLRGEWGFDGYVMSDWGAVSDRVKGVHAGLELEMPSSSGANDKRVVEAVRSGELDEKDVDLAVERLITIHNRYLDNAKPETVWDKDQQHELAKQISAESMVLLKNEDGILPLKDTDKIAVIGCFAEKPRYQGGGSSHINSFRVESLLDALAGYENFTYSKGYDTEKDEADESLISEAVSNAKTSDKAVLVLGLPDAFESEGYDRTHMRIPSCQIELLKRVYEVNKSIIVVLYNGSPIEMPWIDSAKAVIEAYLGGQAVGGATKAVLFGEINPSGRLPETFPIRLEDNPSYLTYGGEGNTAVYSEGVFVGYRYYDKKKMNVLFPFGHGLSYTTFEYKNLSVSSDSIKDTDEITVTVDVVNTGNRFGKEVVQLYVSDPESAVFRPERELKGFEKVSLNPGETKSVSFKLSKRAFAYWNTTLSDWHVETGAFLIQIAKSSRDVVLEKEIFVESTVSVPVKYDINSIMLDLLENPKAAAILAPILDGMKKAMGIGQGGEDSAISDSMMTAMIKYLPLRNIASFSGGAISLDQLQMIVNMLLNAREAK